MLHSKEREEVVPSNGSTSNNSNVGGKHPRPVTVEKVRMIMEQEGRSARNLVSWSIPLDTYQYSSHKDKVSRTKRMDPANDINEDTKKPTQQISGERKKGGRQANVTPTRRSAGGDTTRKQVSIRARYWAYLFDNLRRAVDEIYGTCETDASVVECKEVLLILDNYRHEFQALIDWIVLQEKLENSDIHNRPTSLTWEVRKSSPGRPRLPQRVAQHQQQQRQQHQQNTKINSSVPPAPLPANHTNSNRRLPPVVAHQQPATDHVTTGKSPDRSPQQKQPTATTWADRVKGLPPPPPPKPAPPLPPPSTQNHAAASQAAASMDDVTTPEDDNVDDVDGGGEWETVASRNHHRHHQTAQRAKHIKPKPAAHPQERKRTAPPQVGAVSAAEKLSSVDADASSGGGGGEIRETKAKHDADGLRDLDAVEEEFFNEGKDDRALKGGKRDAKPNGIVQTSVTPSPAKSDGGDAVAGLLALEQKEASLARTLHAEHDASIAVAEQTERDLMRQIREVEQEPETPDLDTDCDSARSSAGAKEIANAEKTMGGGSQLEWSDFMSRFEAEQQARAGISWGDLVEEEELREPGGIVQMHEKLSSPSRKRYNTESPAESKRKLEEKHRKAEVRRQRMHRERTERIHELTEKVQEVVSWKNDLIRRQRNLLQSSQSLKLERAKEQRELKLRKIVEKAQAEDTKVNEIAFINELQEKNKRHEVLMRIDEHESRIHELELERTKVVEEKSAKEEIVKERRRAIEKERQDRIEELKSKRKEQDARIEQQRIDRDKEREKVAKERARDRELRLSALNAAQQEAVSELQKKIQIKHDESVRRHQEQLEQRKEKAVELSIPSRFTPASATTNLKLEINQSMTSVGGKSDATYVVDHDRTTALEAKFALTDVTVHTAEAGTPQKNAAAAANDFIVTSVERRKTLKKRAKKLRTRMSNRAREFLKRMEDYNEPTWVSANKSRVVRQIKDVNRVVAAQANDAGPWPANRVGALDRCFGEIWRILGKQNRVEQNNFRIGGGFQMLDDVFQLTAESFASGRANASLPDKSVAGAAWVFDRACAGSRDNTVYALYSNRLTALVDLLMLLLTKNKGCDSRSLSPPSGGGGGNFEAALPALFKALATALSNMCESPSNHHDNSTANNNKNAGMTSSFDYMITTQTSRDDKKAAEAYLNRGLDVVSYVVANGVLDTLSVHLRAVRNQARPGTNKAVFVEHSLEFLQSATSFVTVRNRAVRGSENVTMTSSSTSSDKRRDSSVSSGGGAGGSDSDPSQLLPTLQHTELMGVVSVLYGLLMHRAPERPTHLRSDDHQSPQLEPIPAHTLSVSLAVMRVLNAAAEMDLGLVQSNLGAEGLSLEFRHICAYLLWYCVHANHCHDGLLHEVIICVGHFALGNRLNQECVDSGAQPTILQQLCLLPFGYFSDPHLSHILFPTLIACCHDNKPNLATLQLEASGQILATYIQSELEDDGRDNDDVTAKSKMTSSTKLKAQQKESRPRSLADNFFYTDQLLRDALAFFSSADVITAAR